MGTVEVPSKSRLVAARVAAVAYVLALLALAISGGLLWRMYCEGFGCVGKGVAWFAWAIGFTAALILGYMAHYAYQGAGRVGLRYLLALQAVAGVGLVIYWAAWRAA